jgi:hypothetical protein
MIYDIIFSYKRAVFFKMTTSVQPSLTGPVITKQSSLYLSAVLSAAYKHRPEHTAVILDVDHVVGAYLLGVPRVGDFVPVEAETASIIRQVQKAASLVLFETARPSNSIDITINQLHNIGVSTLEKAPQYEDKYLTEDGCVFYSYKDGVICTNCNDKGVVANNFLLEQMRATKIKHLVFVDNQDGNLFDMAMALRNSALETLSLIKYTGAGENQEIDQKDAQLSDEVPLVRWAQVIPEQLRMEQGLHTVCRSRCVQL